MIHFGFSYMGLIFLLMLFIPNIIWTKHKPKDYEQYVVNENKVLLLFERIGEILICGIVLIFAVYGVQRSPFCFRAAVFRSQRPPIFC